MSTLKTKKVQLGDNADPSKNFLIEVPAVADGTLSIKRQDGTNVLSIAANGKAVIPGVVGTVAQIGGIPTGQVVERGSNANGEYVRFADGTQICKAIYLDTPALAVTVSANVFNTSNAWTFPAEFAVTVPTVQYGITSVSNTQSHTTTLSTTTTLSVAQIGVFSNVAQTYRLNAIAIGRWY